MVSHRIVRSLRSLLSLGLSVSLTGVCAAADSSVEAPASIVAARHPATLLLADSGSTNQWHSKPATPKSRAGSKPKKPPRGKHTSGKFKPKKSSRTSPGRSSSGNSATK
jgi:hypothetical protein